MRPRSSVIVHGTHNILDGETAMRELNFAVGKSLPLNKFSTKLASRSRPDIVRDTEEISYPTHVSLRFLVLLGYTEVPTPW